MSDVLQTILSRAELQHTEDDDDSSFLAALLQQAAAELSAERLSLWLVTPQSHQRVTQVGNGNHPELTADSVAAAVSGTVRSVADSGSSSTQKLATSHLATDTRLILECVEGSHPIDDELMLQLADVAADLQRRRMLDGLLQAARQSDAWRSVTTQLHQSLDSEQIAHAIATDAATVIPCRRLSVLRRRGRSWQVMATTGVSQPDQRSDACRRIRNAVEVTAGQVSNSAVDPSVHVIPMQEDQNWDTAHWAVVLEDADCPPEDERCRQLLTHARLALENSDAAQQSSPGRRFTRVIGSLTRRRGLAILSLLLAVAGALLFLRTTLRVEVYGTLVPATRVHVFAPDNGTITTLHVDEHAQVQEQQVLCVLTNDDLAVEAQKTAGELAAANARMAAIDALRSGSRGDDTESRLLSAERAELAERVKSLQKQTTIIERRLTELTIRSRIAGRVYGDHLQQMLLQRPVQQGQYLFEIADPSDSWQLHLRVPEADARYVQQAMQQSEQSPAVSYALETAPEQSAAATLISLGQAVETDDRGLLSTLVIAAPQAGISEQERPGAGVVARISCGRYRLGFVWFRQVIEFLQRRVFA